MSDRAGAQRATSDGASDASVHDDDLASAIAAETARGTRTGQVPTESGGDEADRPVAETPAATSTDAGSADGRSTDAESADVMEPGRSAVAPRSFGSHRAPVPDQEPAPTGRPHGRRAAARAPRVRTSPTAPIRVPDAGPAVASPPARDEWHAQQPFGDPLHEEEEEEREEEAPAAMRPAPRPEPTGPALVWAPADPFVDAPRPKGRSSYVSPAAEIEDTAAARSAAGRGDRVVDLPQVLAARPVDEPRLQPEPAAPAEVPAPAESRRPDSEERRPDSQDRRPDRRSLRPDLFDDGLPPTVAMPVQRAVPHAPYPEVPQPAPQSAPQRSGEVGSDGTAQVPVPAEAALRRRDRRRSAPEGEPVERVSSLWGTLLVWSGSFATPLAVVLGFAIGGARASLLAPLVLIVAFLPVLPAIVRVTVAASQTGVGTAGIARALLGARAGTIMAVFLLAVRVLVLSEVLLGIGFVVGAFAPVLAGGAVRPAELPAIAAVVIAGLLAVAATVWQPRVSGPILVAFAVVALAVATVLLFLLPPSATPATLLGPGDLAAALAGLVGVGLLVLLNAAELARFRVRRGPAAGALLGTLGGVLVALVVLAVSIEVGRSLGAPPGASATSFVSRLLAGVGSRAIAFVGLPVSLAVQTLPIVLLRGAADSAAESLGRRQAAPGAAAVLGISATLVAVVLIGTGADAVSTAALLVPLVGVPVAAWAGLLAVASIPVDPAARPRSRAHEAALIGVAVGTVVGWLSLAVPVPAGWPSALVAAIVALLIGALGGLTGSASDRRAAAGSSQRGDDAELAARPTLGARG